MKLQKILPITIMGLSFCMRAVSVRAQGEEPGLHRLYKEYKEVTAGDTFRGKKSYFELLGSPLFQWLELLAEPDKKHENRYENVAKLLEQEGIRKEITELLNQPYSSVIETSDVKQFIKDILEFAQEIDLDALKNGTMAKMLILDNKAPNLSPEMLNYAVGYARDGETAILFDDPKGGDGLDIIMELLVNDYELTPHQLSKAIKDIGLLYLVGEVEAQKEKKVGKKTEDAEESLSFFKVILRSYIESEPLSKENMLELVKKRFKPTKEGDGASETAANNKTTADASNVSVQPTSQENGSSGGSGNTGRQSADKKNGKKKVKPKKKEHLFKRA